MERTILIGAIAAKDNEIDVEEYIKELEFLTETAGGEVIKIF